MVAVQQRRRADPETLVEGVRAVLPGSVVTIRAGRLTTRAMVLADCATSRAPSTIAWRRGPRTRSSTSMDATLQDACGCGWSATCPSARSLSGGLDSSLITAIAARYSDDLSGLPRLGAGAREFDERRHAELVARKLDIPLVLLRDRRGELPPGAAAGDLLVGPAAHASELGRLHLISQGRARARRHRAAVGRGRRRAVRRLQLATTGAPEQLLRLRPLL